MPEMPRPCAATKRFIHPVADKHDVGTVLMQLINQAREAQGTNRFPHLLRRPSQVPDTQVMLRKAAVQEGLEIAEVMHSLGERVAEDHDVVALLYLEVVGPRC